MSLGTNLRMEKSEQNIRLIIFFPNYGEEIDITTPIVATINEIIEALQDEGIIPRTDSSGHRAEYIIYKKGNGTSLQGNIPLDKIGLKNNDRLILSRLVSAGGSGESFYGNMTYFLPEKLSFRQKKVCSVRIAKKEIAKFILTEKYPSKEISEIEINDLMIVKLEENANDKHLQINPLSTEEQIISDVSFSEWKFELIPKKTGFTSVILRIIMPKIIEGFGERYKDVLLLNKEIEITSSSIGYGGEEKIMQFKNIFEWTDSFRDDIYNFISENKTGKAITKLINFFQNHDLEVLNAIIIFQAQWNEGKNRCLLNLISQSDWMMLQTKINYGILEIIRNIENKKRSNQFNLPVINRIENQVKEVLTHN